MELVDAVVSPPPPEAMALALHEAQELLVANGITAVVDMGTIIEDWMAFRRAGDTGRLRIRIMSYAASVPEMLLIGGTGPTPWLYDDQLRLNGVKLYLDGALGSRGAALKADYADDPGNRGLQLLAGAQLRNLMSRAALVRFQVAIHPIGVAANYEAPTTIEELSRDYPGGRRWRIEHAQVVDPGDIPLFRAKASSPRCSRCTRPPTGWCRGAARTRPPRRRLCPALDCLDGRAARLRLRCAGRGARSVRRHGRRDQPHPFRGRAVRRLDARGGGQPRGDLVMLARDPLLASLEELREMRVSKPGLRAATSTVRQMSAPTRRICAPGQQNWGLMPKIGSPAHKRSRKCPDRRLWLKREMPSGGFCICV